MWRWLTFLWHYVRPAIPGAGGRPPWDSGIPAPELVREIAGRRPGRALDLGCGTGTNVRYLAERGWQVTGVDFIPPAIAQARRKTRGLEARVTLRVGDVTKLAELALPGPFDLALDMGCFHALDATGRGRYAAGLATLVKPAGDFLLYAFQPDPARRLWGLTREQIEAEFAAGFTLKRYEQGQGRPSAWYYFRRRTADN